MMIPGMVTTRETCVERSWRIEMGWRDEVSVTWSVMRPSSIAASSITAMRTAASSEA